MTPLQNIIWIVATACIVFLIVAHFRGSKLWQRGRDILLVISCGLDSGVFFYAHAYWMATAYAIPALIQAQALIADRPLSFRARRRRR